MTMTLWYDVTDLVSWRLPHLTGIQRTVVGVLSGIRSQGIPVGLVAFEAGQGFRTAELSEFPEFIRRALDDGSADVGASSSAAPSRSRSRTPAALRRIPALGADEAGQDLDRAMREVARALRRLHGAGRRWAGSRLSRALGRQQPASAGPMRLAMSLPARLTGPISPGDSFVSLGASFVDPAHAACVAALRSRGIRVVRMIYDLIPTLKPEWVDDPDHGVRHARPITEWARRVLGESDCVVTISEFSRQEILRYCAEAGIVPPSIAVVRLGDDLGALPEHPPLPRFVPSRPFILCVSTLDIRKNHRLLYEAWCILAARDPAGMPDLVCVGTPHLYVKDLLREMRLNRDVNRRIHVVHDCADEELAWYYRRCAATIYPSRYEGWGLPVAESLAHGRLVLASNATSIPEIGGDLPAYFDPVDVHGVVALVERTLDDPQWVAAREQAIRERFVPTPWTRTASQVLGALDAAPPRRTGSAP